MSIQRTILTISIALSLSSVAPAQRVKARRAKPNDSVSKPSVYLSFVRFGKREPLHTEESSEGVWLRLHNNTRWPLVLKAHGGGGRIFATGNKEEVGMFYGVEEFRERVEIVMRDAPLEPPPPSLPSGLDPEWDKRPAPIPPRIEEDCPAPANDWCFHVCSVVSLAPGKSLVFSLPRETLCKNLRVYLVFNYSWEARNGFVGEAPEHRVYFYGSALLKVPR
jgi:hypothetical protein